MKLIQHYSSSKGNLYEVVASNGHRLIIDPGVSRVKLLRAIGTVDKVDAFLLTHEHKDHSRAAVYLSRLGVPCYGSLGTINGSSIKGHDTALPVKAEQWHKISDTFEIWPFNLVHDAVEPTGFWIHDKCRNMNLLFVGETQFIPYEFYELFDIIALNVSYDKDILYKRVEEDTINLKLAKRLRECHLSTDEALNFLNDLDLSRCEEIHLLHVSADNCDKKKLINRLTDQTWRTIITL